MLRECLEGRQGRPGTPESRPWSAWERAKATKIDAKSRPRAEKSSFLRVAHSQSIVGAMFRRFWSIFGFSAKSANPGSALRAASRVARATQPRKTTKIGLKIDPKSLKIVSWGRSGALFSRLWSLEAARSSDSERLGATRATRRATRSDQVGRSGSVGVDRVGQVAREARVPIR